MSPSSLAYICTRHPVAAWGAGGRLWPRPLLLCGPAGQRGKAGWAEVDLEATAEWTERTWSRRARGCLRIDCRRGRATGALRPSLQKQTKKKWQNGWVMMMMMRRRGYIFKERESNLPDSPCTTGWSDWKCLWGSFFHQADTEEAPPPPPGPEHACPLLSHTSTSCLHLSRKQHQSMTCRIKQYIVTFISL